MKRREFLKLGTAAIAVAVFPKIAVDAARPVFIGFDLAKLGGDRTALAEMRIGRIDNVRSIETSPNHWDSFDPAWYHGNILPLTYKPCPELRERLLLILYSDMKRQIPPQYRNRIEIVQPARITFGRGGGIGWSYTPA
ncbi:MAG: hypothetical protein V3R76_00215 [Gammaproteobacteria bacterium]